MNSLFEEVSYKRLKTLLEITLNINDNSLERIRFIYEQRDLYFKKNLEIAKGFKLLNIKHNKAKLSKKIKSVTENNKFKDEELKTLIISSILSTNNYFRNEIKEYLSNFEFNQSIKLRIQTFNFIQY